MDGEGSIQLHKCKSKNDKRNHFYIQVEVGNTYKPIIYYIARLFNKSVIIRKNKEINARKIFYRICFKKDDAVQMLKIIKPYLKIKKEQAKICLDFFKMSKKTSRYKNGKIKIVKIKTYKKRLKMFNRLKQLNKRGKKLRDKKQKCKRW